MRVLTMRKNRFVGRFLREEHAATAIEYTLIAAGISLVIIAVITQIGNQLNVNYFQKMGDGLK